MRKKRLTVEEVISIYKLSSSYEMSLKKIAERFNVSKTTVVRIRERQIRTDIINLWLVLSNAKNQLEQQQDRMQDKIQRILPILKKSIQSKQRC